MTGSTSNLLRLASAFPRSLGEFCLGSMLGLALFGTFTYLAWPPSTALESRLNDLKHRIVERDGEIADIQDLESHFQRLAAAIDWINLFRADSASRVAALQIFTSIPQGVALTRLRLLAGQMTIEGIATSPEAVVAFMQGMESASVLQPPNLLSEARGTQSSKVSFTLEAHLKPRRRNSEDQKGRQDERAQPPIDVLTEPSRDAGHPWLLPLLALLPAAYLIYRSLRPMRGPTEMVTRMACALMSVEDALELARRNEFVGWPTSMRRSLLVVAMTVVAAICWLVLQTPKLEFDHGLGTCEDLIEQLALKSGRVNSSPYKDAKFDSFTRLDAAVAASIPQQTEIDSFLVELRRAALSQGVIIEQSVEKPSIPSYLFAEIPVSVTLTGRYRDLVLLLSEVSRMPRLVGLNAISISASGSPGILRMVAILNLYRALS